MGTEWGKPDKPAPQRRPTGYIVGAGIVVVLVVILLLWVFL